MVSPNLQMGWHFVDVRSNHCINWMEGMMLNMKSNTQPAATQLQKLMEFDRKLFSYTGALAWFMPGLFSFLAILLGCIPYNSYEKGESVPYILIYFTAVIAYFVLLPYQCTSGFEHKTAADNTFKILRYMPVSAKNYVLARMKYVFRFFWKMTAIMTVIQIIISVAAKNFVIENYIYVFCCFMIIPMAEAGIELLITVGLIRNAR